MAMSEADLKAQIAIEEGAALGANGGTLSTERQKALDHYQGLLPGVSAPAGRSDVVSTDVRDAVDGMLPDLLDVFLSSDDVCQFEPQGPEDEAAAKQATDAVNYIFYRQNNGALTMHEWMKSALLEKTSVVKYYWEKYATPSIETYDGLNEVAFQAMLQQPGVTVLEHSASPDPAMQGMSLHDVRIRVVDPNGKICVDGIPSEEFKICADHRSLSMGDCRFSEHLRPMTVSQIRAMGIDVDPNEADDPADGRMSPEYSARRRYDEEVQSSGGVPSNDPASRQITFREISMLVDVDGDGYAERRRIVKIGSRIYENDYADHVPFAAICPVIMPYRFYGLSIADLVGDIQELKSVIWRQMLDSLYLSINPRIGVMESMVNLDDLLVSRPGGVVRFKTQPAMAWAPLEQKFVGQQAFPMLEHLDSVKENRTGFTRYSQGLDANSLNKTATGVSLISSAAAKRMKMIARMFAETGVKDLMQGIKHLLVKHNSGRQIAMRMRGQWVNVDPREWKTKWDMTVNVGLGTNDKQAQAAHLQQIGAAQAAIRQMGFGHLVSDTNVYNVGKRMAESTGFKQENEFFTPPGKNNPMPPPQPPPELIKIKSDAEIEMARMQSEERKKAAEVANGQAVARIQAETSVAVAQIKAESDRQIAAMKAEHDRQTQERDNRHKAELEIFRQANKPESKSAQAR